MDWSPSSYLTAYLATFQWMAAFVHPEGEVWLFDHPNIPLGTVLVFGRPRNALGELRLANTPHAKGAD
jgi:hypothetical protein